MVLRYEFYGGEKTSFWDIGSMNDRVPNEIHRREYLENHSEFGLHTLHNI
jgi:hypothetical protein